MVPGLPVLRGQGQAEMGQSGRMCGLSAPTHHSAKGLNRHQPALGTDGT